MHLKNTIPQFIMSGKLIQTDSIFTFIGQPCRSLT